MGVTEWISRTRRWTRQFGHITRCYSYHCRYGRVCLEASLRPRQVLKRRCINYWPQYLRPPSGLSDLALDILASHREKGLISSVATLLLLDRLRPHGPLRMTSRRAPYRPP